MNLTFQDAKITLDNGVWLCIKVAEPAPAREFVLTKKDRVYSCEIKEHRGKRSLEANRYYWELCGKLAKAVNTKPENIYRSHIRDIANYETICIQTKALDDFKRRWCSNHLGRFVETRESKIPGCTTVLAYYGSSDFDSGEMSRLIDNCIQDCKAVGIETLPPDKIQLLKEEWGRAPTDKGDQYPANDKG